MTDVTSNPTRAEVERLACELPGSQPYSNNNHNAADLLRTLAAENAALREKLEAAERRMHQCAAQRDRVISRAERAEAALTEARAQATAAWMAGRDAAAEHARWDNVPFIRTLTPPSDHTAALTALLDAELERAAKIADVETGWNGQPHMSAMQYGPGIGARIADRIRALRRRPA